MTFLSICRSATKIEIFGKSIVAGRQASDNGRAPATGFGTLAAMRQMYNRLK